MPAKTRTVFPPSSRTTAPLSSTVEEARVSLDAASALAVRWAQAWTRRTSKLKHPISGIARRALQHYVSHPYALGNDPDAARAEIRRLEATCRPLPLGEGEHEQRLARLVAVPDDEPLPHLLRIEHPNGQDANERLLDRHETLLPQRYRIHDQPQISEKEHFRP